MGLCLADSLLVCKGDSSRVSEVGILLGIRIANVSKMGSPVKCAEKISTKESTCPNVCRILLHTWRVDVWL